MRKILFCFLLLTSLAVAQIPYTSVSTLASFFYSQFNAYEVHSSSSFERLGALRGVGLNNAVWVNEKFGFLGNREQGYTLDMRESYNDLAFGMDTFFELQNANLFMGGFFDIIAGNNSSIYHKGNIGNYAIGAYMTYFHQKRFFVDVSAKFFYSTREFVINESYLNNSVLGDGTSNFYIGVNIGQRFNVSPSLFLQNFFFLEPSLVIESGYLPTQKMSLKDGTSGEMRGFVPLGLKLNLAFGKEWNTQYGGALRGGVSWEYDRAINGNITIKDITNPPIKLGKSNDFRFGMFLEADFILNDSFRFFLHSKSTYLGKFNTLYALNFGMRFSFGVLAQHKLHSKKSIQWKSETLQ